MRIFSYYYGCRNHMFSCLQDQEGSNKLKIHQLDTVCRSQKGLKLHCRRSQTNTDIKCSKGVHPHSRYVFIVQYFQVLFLGWVLVLSTRTLPMFLFHFPNCFMLSTTQQPLKIWLEHSQETIFLGSSFTLGVGNLALFLKPLKFLSLRTPHNNDNYKSWTWHTIQQPSSTSKSRRCTNYNIGQDHTVYHYIDYGKQYGHLCNVKYPDNPTIWSILYTIMQENSL